MTKVMIFFKFVQFECAKTGATRLNFEELRREIPVPGGFEPFRTVFSSVCHGNAGIRPVRAATAAAGGLERNVRGGSGGHATGSRTAGGDGRPCGAARQRGPDMPPVPVQGGPPGTGRVRNE
jgi:hypothetical protein